MIELTFLFSFFSSCMFTLCHVSSFCAVIISQTVFHFFSCYYLPLLRPSRSQTTAVMRSVTHLLRFLLQTLGDGENPLKGPPQLEVSFSRKQQPNGVWRGAIQTALIMLWGVYISADDESPSHQAKQPEKTAGGGGEGYDNHFLKSLGWRL